MDEDDYGYEPRSVSLGQALRFLDLEWMIPVAMIGGLIAPALMYVIARSRANRESINDPQLGFKFVLGYFKTISYHLMLAGTVILTFGIIMKSGGASKEMIYRPAVAVLMPAGILYAIHAWALTRTNQLEHGMVGRILAGFSLIQSGVLGTVAVLAVFQMLFEKGSSGNGGRFFWALFLVYGTAWFVQALRFYKRVQFEPLYAAPGMFYPPPQQPAPPPPNPAAYAPPGVVAAAPPPAPAPVVQNVVPLPAPMAIPLAPPGTGPGGSTPGTTL